MPKTSLQQVTFSIVINLKYLAHHIQAIINGNLLYIMTILSLILKSNPTTASTDNREDIDINLGCVSVLLEKGAKWVLYGCEEALSPIVQHFLAPIRQPFEERLQHNLSFR